jgi:hypothetical protein
MRKQLFLMLALAIFIASCTKKESPKTTAFIQDKPFVQDYSIKYNNENKDAKLLKVVSDRNGYIQILSDKGLLRLKAGQFLFPGTIVKDVQDLPTSDKKIGGIGIYQNQLVYVDDKAVLSNAWAGKLFSKHEMPAARILEGGNDFSFFISDGKNLALLKDSQKLWEGSLSGKNIIDIKFDAQNNLFWMLTPETVSSFNPDKKEITEVFSGSNLTCFEETAGKIIVGTTDGYFEIDAKTGKQNGEVQRKMPWTELTSVSEIDGKIWFGSTWGAMRLNEDGKFSYYAGKRWIPSDTVIHIAEGPENSVLVLTNSGLGKICFEEMTLHEKAMFYQKQVRERHIRTGFNGAVGRMTDGDVTTGTLENSDNDGLWTSMYLAAEAFRYSVTKEDDALQNVRESLDAMERLYTINPLKSGFPSRSFQRSGYNNTDKPWRPTEDPEWDWKSTTSSDEAIGHIFAFSVIAELVDVPELKSKSIELIDTLMSHTLKNDYYLIDWNGEPTLWGKWNPKYVNGFPTNVGDRKINSSNYIGMLQTAYHFTKKEKYKEAAFYLMNEHGYLENLMRPMSEINFADEDADEYAKMLSDGWNHSDDEMYYCGYWGLFRYAFNDTLKANYQKAIVDHWEAERPEKEGLWNMMTGLVGNEDYDYENAAWYLRKYPLDLVDWTVQNSHRKDIEMMEPNFRKQTIKEVLPPGELRVSRHNANRFDLDSHGGGRSGESAGDIWLLPYWIGRYLGVISEPVQK